MDDLIEDQSAIDLKLREFAWDPASMIPELNTSFQTIMQTLIETAMTRTQRKAAHCCTKRVCNASR